MEDSGIAPDDAFELSKDADAVQADKTVDASSSDPGDFSKTVDIAATVKAEDVAQERPAASEKTVRSTLPAASDEAFELIDDAVSVRADKTVDASSINPGDFSKTVDVAATVKDSDVEEKVPAESEKTLRENLPDSRSDASFEQMDKTITTEFEKTLDTGTVKEDALESVDKTINVAVAKTIDTAGFAENPEYYQTQKTVSRVSEQGTVSSLSEMPKRVLNASVDSHQITDYELEKELGKGSFGVVWRARQKALNRTVALKLLHEKQDPAAKKRDQTVVETKEQVRRRTEFLREAQFNGRLDHPNIVPIHELGIGEDGSPFYAMKEIRGISWRNVIRDKSLQENLEILERVADAMSFAHSRGILHCDLKPDNVMLGEFGEVLVVDWGQAIDLAVPETFRPGGSPVYIPPEMAQYFRDTILAKEASASRSLVGKRSDTYLLGAILFEIITGFAPHPCIKGDTISDVLRRAADNEIRDYSEFADDELMQIALQTMGAEGRHRYETVAELQEALRQYESRQRSIEARVRAEEDLAAAKASKNYDAFQKARFGFEEATELWPDNIPAQRGLRETRLSFAKLALDNQDFDLGLGQLGEPKEEAESGLKVQLTKGRRARDRRKKLVVGLLFTVAAAVTLGAAINAFQIKVNIKTKSEARVAIAELNDAVVEANEKVAEATEAVEDAEIQKGLAESKAKDAERLAVDATDRAEAADLAAQAADKLAQKAKAKADAAQLAFAEAEKAAQDAAKQAEESKVKAEQADQAAQLARKQAEDSQAKADEAVRMADQAREEAKIVSFKNNISNIDRLISAGEYQIADGLLQGIEKTNRQWEWGRLRLLTHPEVEPLPTDLVVSQSLSGDGQWLALASAEGVQILNVADFELETIAPGVLATAVALSSDARRLAVALPSKDIQKPNTIKIYELDEQAQLNSKAQEVSLSAQSIRVNYLEFSPAGDRLLSVGEPDPRSKGDVVNGGESDLMVWELDEDEWKRIPCGGKVMSSARFSTDGNRIVTAGYATIHVLERIGDEYTHLTNFSYAAKNDPVINVAVFADKAGDKVMCACQDSSIVQWSVSLAVEQRKKAEKSSEQLVKVTSAQPEPTSAVLDVFPGHSRAVLSLAVVRRDDQENQIEKGIMVSAGEDGTLLRWNLADGAKQEFRGYTNSISYCAVTSDGQTILSVSSGIDSSEIRKIDLRKYNDELVRLSEPARPLVNISESMTMKEKAIFCSDDGRVYAYRVGRPPQLDAAWSASPQWKRHLSAGGKVFSESNENSIYVWDEESGELEQMIDQVDSFKLFDVSRDGKTIVFLRTATDDASQGAQIDVWDVEKHERKLTISGPPNQQFSSLAISHDGKWVVGGYSGLFVWSTGNGELQFRTTRGAQDPQGRVERITFLGNSTKLIASWNQDWLRVFDVAEGASTQYDEYRFRDDYQSLVDAALIDSEQYILLKSKRGFEVWNLPGKGQPVLADAVQTGQEARFSQKEPRVVLVVNRSGDSGTVVAWDWKNKVKRDLSIGNVLAGDALNRAKFTINLVEQSADGRFLVQARGQLVALSADLQIESLRVVRQTACIYAAYAGKDRVITLHGGKDARIRFWKLGEGEASSRHVTPDGQLPGTYSVCQVSPDERYLLAIDSSGKVMTVYDLRQNKAAVELEPAVSAITAVAWSADSMQIVTGAESGTVSLWGLGDQGKTLEEKEQIVAGVEQALLPVRAVALDESANSILVIRQGAANLHRKIGEVWIAIDLPHAGETVAGDISPDGKRAVTASQFGSLILWNTDEIGKTMQLDTDESGDQANERALLEFYQHKSEVRFVKFSDDGKSLISAEADVAGALIWPTLWEQPID